MLSGSKTHQRPFLHLGNLGESVVPWKEGPEESKEGRKDGEEGRKEGRGKAYVILSLRAVRG